MKIFDLFHVINQSDWDFEQPCEQQFKRSFLTKPRHVIVKDVVPVLSFDLQSTSFQVIILPGRKFLVVLALQTELK